MAIGDDLRYNQADLLALLGSLYANLELANRQKQLKDQRIEGLEQEVNELKTQLQKVGVEQLALAERAYKAEQAQEVAVQELSKPKRK